MAFRRRNDYDGVAVVPAEDPPQLGSKDLLLWVLAHLGRALELVLAGVKAGGAKGGVNGNGPVGAVDIGTEHETASLVNALIEEEGHTSFADQQDWTAPLIRMHRPAYPTPRCETQRVKTGLSAAQHSSWVHRRAGALC